MSDAVIGMYDDLDKQSQPFISIDVTAGNFLVFGGHQSGKTTFIKTLLIRLHEELDEERERNVYILDFGGNLGLYKDLNLISACFDSSNEENIRRVFRAIEAKLEDNKKMLSAKNFKEVFNSDSAEKPSHLMLVIDNVNGFLTDERYDNYHDKLLKMARDGVSKGLTIVFTASDMSGGLSRYMGSFAFKYALSGMSESYGEIFGMRVEPPMNYPGRGVTVIEGKLREFQFFKPFRNEEKDIDGMKKALSHIHLKTEKLVAFEGDLNNDNLYHYLIRPKTDGDESKEKIIVGLDYYDHTPISVDLRQVHSIGIYGKKGSGKTNLLCRILRKLREIHTDYRIIYFDDGRKELRPLYEEDRYERFYITSIESLSDFMDSNGYAPKIVYDATGYGEVNRNFTEKNNPPTVFVLQNKMLFQQSGRELMYIFPRMIASAEEKNYLFIYSDIRKFSNNDREAESSLNNSIMTAFLLDNIAEFVQDRGSRSVFGEMDPKELKTEYARCETGDGYCFDIEADELRKCRFIKE